MFYCRQVNVSLVNYLVEQGGTVSADKNSDEKTVLHLMAEQCGATDLTPIIKILAKQVSHKIFLVLRKFIFMIVF